LKPAEILNRQTDMGNESCPTVLSATLAVTMASKHRSPRRPVSNLTAKAATFKEKNGVGVHYLEAVVLRSG